MQVFITGTDTDIGKTVVASWLCLHTSYDYFKPLQTGSRDGTDSQIVKHLTKSTIFPETFVYKEPASPHFAAHLENEVIDITKIKLPSSPNLIIEGAGGLMVPINKDALMIDLIKEFDIPVIVVARSGLGTINHTLLSLEALRARGIQVLGIIMSGDINSPNRDAIEFYGKVSVLAQIPHLPEITLQSLSQIPLTHDLKRIFKLI